MLVNNELTERIKHLKTWISNKKHTIEANQMAIKTHKQNIKQIEHTNNILEKEIEFNIQELNKLKQLADNSKDVVGDT